MTSTDTKLGRPDYYCLAALWGVVLLAYWELWMPGRILIKRDAFLFFPPIKQYIVDRLASGHLPEWFPYEGLGRPFLSIPVTGMFHPFTALYAVLSPHDAYRTSVLLSCLIGVSGMFWLGRTLGYSRIAAVGSALTFILSGYACSLTENIVYFYSFCLLPLFCGSLHRAFHEGGRWLVIGAIVWASVLLHGDIQSGYYYGFVALAWAAVRSTKSSRSHCASVMAMAALAGLLASIQLGPAWVVFNESHRMDSGSFYRDASYWSLHPLRLLAMLVGPVGGDWSEAKVASVLYGSDNAGTAGSGLWAESLYLGTIAAGLAWQGIRGRRDLRPVAILGAITLLLALGKYGRLYDLFYTYFPLWSAFRYPERLMSIVTFVLALFTGAGIDVMKSRERSAFPWLLAGLIATLLWVSSIGAQAQWAAVSGLTEETVRVFGSAFALPLLYGALVMLGMAALLYVLRRDVIAMNTALIALVLFSSLDLWRVNARAILVGPSEAATFSPLFAEAIHKERSPDTDDRVRVLSLHDAALVAPGELAGRLDDRALTSIVMKQVLSAEHNASYRIESAQVYLPGFPPEATYLEDHPNPLLSASHPVVFQVRQSRSLPLISSESSRLPASNPPLAIHSGTEDKATVPVASAASIENLSPNWIFPLTGRRSGGAAISSRVSVTSFDRGMSPSNVTVTDAPVGFSRMEGRVTLASVKSTSPRRCGAAVAPVTTTIALASPSTTPWGNDLSGRSCAMWIASPLIRTARSLNTLPVPPVMPPWTWTVRSPRCAVTWSNCVSPSANTNRPCSALNRSGRYAFVRFTC